MAGLQKRQNFESHLGTLSDPGVAGIGGTNEIAGGTAPLSSQDAIVSSGKLAGLKTTAYSAQNASLNAEQPTKLDPKDFPAQAYHDGQVPGGIGSGEENSPTAAPSDDEWSLRAKNAFRTADAFFNSEVRSKLEDNIRAFNSEHRASSIYVRSPAGWTSKLYKPKTREVLNKYQAAHTVAFFSNDDIASIEAQNPYDASSVIAAAFYKALLQHRLKKSIPWYLLCNGAFQDSMVQGIVVGHVRWENKKDKPEIKIYPLDKVRFDPEADWIDPVNDSPYWITIREMTIGDFKAMVQRTQGDANAAIRYYSVDDSLFSQALSGSMPDLDAARNQGKSSVSYNATHDYQRILVQEHIHRIDDEDHIFYMLGDVCRVSDVVPLEQVYKHGKRPYVLGYAEIESHRVFVAGFPQMLQGLQDELNEITNQRLNNVKLVMNKKIAYKRGAYIDLNALLRNQPGAAVPMDNPQEDFAEINTPDVTQSAYLESESLSKDFDALSGNFQPQQGLTNRQPEGGRTMSLLNSNVNVLLEYRLRTFATTFVTPMIGLLALTERFYESDPKVLELIARQIGIVRDMPQLDPNSSSVPASQPGAGTPPAMGMGSAPNGISGAPAPAGAGAPLPNPLGGQSQDKQPPIPQPAPFTDFHLQATLDLLKKDLDINANVGMNATDPMLKLQKLLAAINALLNWLSSPKAMVLDIEEIAKEVFALSGYIDGLRFLKRTADPQIVAMQQQIMQLTTQLKFKLAEKQLEGKNRLAAISEKEKHADMRKAAELEHDSKRLVLDHSREMQQHGDEMALQALEAQQPPGAPQPGAAPPQQ